MNAPFRLRVEVGGEVKGDLVFDQNVVTVGRSPSCDLHIDSKVVSRQHLEILRSSQGFVVYAQSTTNRTEIDGEVVPPEETRPLPEGGVITLAGKLQIVFTLAPGERASDTSRILAATDDGDVTSRRVDTGGLLETVAPPDAPGRASTARTGPPRSGTARPPGSPPRPGPGPGPTRRMGAPADVATAPAVAKAPAPAKTGRPSAPPAGRPAAPTQAPTPQAPTQSPAQSPARADTRRPTPARVEHPPLDFGSASPEQDPLAFTAPPPERSLSDTDPYGEDVRSLQTAAPGEADDPLGFGSDPGLQREPGPAGDPLDFDSQPGDPLAFTTHEPPATAAPSGSRPGAQAATWVGGVDSKAGQSREPGTPTGRPATPSGRTNSPARTGAAAQETGAPVRAETQPTRSEDREQTVPAATVPPAAALAEADPQTGAIAALLSWRPADVVEVASAPRARRGPPGARMALEVRGAERKVDIHDDLLIGAGHDSDVLLRGAYAPRRAALVIRVADEYRLYGTSHSPQTVRVNGRGVEGQVPLRDGDELEVYGVRLRFERA